MITKNFIGIKLRKLRENKMISIVDLAKDLKVGIMTISEIERDKRNPRLSTIKKIAIYFNVDSGYFLKNKKEIEK